jgi:uncharacterized protein (TIRG00374 family)
LASGSDKKKTQYISIIARISIAILAVGLFLRGENLGELYAGIKSIDPWVFLAAVGLYGVGQCLFIMRWRLLLRVLSIDLKFFAGLKLHMLGLFYNNCLPSSVGGDLLRAWYVTKHASEDKRFEAALSVFVDRAVGLLGMLMMAAGFYWLFPVEELASQPENVAQKTGKFTALSEWFSTNYYVLLAVLAVFCLIFAIFLKSRKNREKVWQTCTKLWCFGVKVMQEITSAARLYWRNPGTILAALMLTFMCQGLTILGFYLLGRNLGADVSIKYYYVFFPMSWLIGTLPISIGGLGIVEGWLKVAFKSVGVPSRIAALIALCQRLIMLTGSLPGVFIHIFGAHLPSAKEMEKDTEEADHAHIERADDNQT